jgi:F-actin monooxygenase
LLDWLVGRKSNIIDCVILSFIVTGSLLILLFQDEDEPERLLSKDNVNQAALLDYARDAANISTKNLLPNLEFAHNHYGQPDVAMFDFTSMYASEHASRVIERQGCRLLVGLVGDTLLEVSQP